MQKNESTPPFFLKDFIYLFLQRGEGREKEREETSMCGCHSPAPTGDLAHSLGMYPDWESNRQTFGSQAHTLPTETPARTPDHLFTTHTNEFKMDKEFNVRPETIKILEENIGSKISDIFNGSISPGKGNKRKTNGTTSN